MKNLKTENIKKLFKKEEASQEVKDLAIKEYTDLIYYMYELRSKLSAIPEESEIKTMVVDLEYPSRDNDIMSLGFRAGVRHLRNRILNQL